MVVKVKEKFEKTRHVKIKDKSEKYILRGKKNEIYLIEFYLIKRNLMISYKNLLESLPWKLKFYNLYRFKVCRQY